MCRKCGADVVDSSYLFTKISPGSKKPKQENIFGKKNVTVQSLVNPFGIKFEIVTAEKARCENVGPVRINQLLEHNLSIISLVLSQNVSL